METFIRRYLWKSSALGWLLFSLLSIPMNAIEIMETDTIILGGKKLIVQQEIKYDTLDTPNNLEEKKVKKRVRFGDWKAGFEGIGYVPLDEVATEQADLSSINAFTGSNRRVGSGMGIAITGEKAIGKQGWNLHAGVGVDFFTGYHLTFDPSELDSSLSAFASFDKNSLAQILLFRFDIGAETDTAALQLTQDPFRSSWAHIPLGLTYERKLNKSFYLRFGAYADLRVLMQGKRPDILFIAENSPVWTQISSDQDWEYRRFTVSPRVGAGFRYAMDRRWYFTGSLNGSLPFNPIDGGTTGLIYRSILFDARIGVSYVFGR